MGTRVQGRYRNGRQPIKWAMRAATATMATSTRSAITAERTRSTWLSIGSPAAPGRSFTNETVVTHCSLITQPGSSIGRESDEVATGGTGEVATMNPTCYRDGREARAAYFEPAAMAGLLVKSRRA